jgi:hypothetical protein
MLLVICTQQSQLHVITSLIASAIVGTEGNSTEELSIVFSGIGMMLTGSAKLQYNFCVSGV